MCKTEKYISTIVEKEILDTKDILDQVHTALFQIHSLAYVLKDMFHHKNITVTNTVNNISDPLISMTQIIEEKAAFCISMIMIITNPPC